VTVKFLVTFGHITLIQDFILRVADSQTRPAM
jgi:hypothetical protein